MLFFYYYTSRHIFNNRLSNECRTLEKLGKTVNGDIYDDSRSHSTQHISYFTIDLRHVLHFFRPSVSNQHFSAKKMMWWIKRFRMYLVFRIILGGKEFLKSGFSFSVMFLHLQYVTTYDASTLAQEACLLLLWLPVSPRPYTRYPKMAV